MKMTTNLFLLQAVIDEHRNINETFHQMSDLVTKWSLADSNIGTTVISSAQYDSNMPQLSRGWSRAVQDVIRVTGSSHHVISDSDRDSLLGDQVSQVLAPVIRIIKSVQQKL